MSTTVEAGVSHPNARQVTLTLHVASVAQIADGVRHVVLRSPDAARLPDWSPGAHIDVYLPTGQVRQYSLCGNRWDAYSYEIAVLREENGRGGSRYIHDNIRPGDTVGVGGPRNNFPMAPATGYLFIAGGIGITPLLPMIHQAEVLGIHWALLYGGRSIQSMAFTGQLVRHSHRVTFWPFDSHGLLPLSQRIAALPEGAKIYCCGPAGLLGEVERLGQDLPRGSVRTERFVAEATPAPVRSTPYTVRLQRSNISIRVAPSESVLDSIAAAGVTVLSSCGRGLCGTCETTVIEGIPDHRDSLLDDQERRRGTSMLPCVSGSCSDLLVLDL
ncbi:PDR/VanB family oxidoreductase [Mycolicibacterium sp. CBM1]